MVKPKGDISIGWIACIAPFLYGYLACLGAIDDVASFDSREGKKWNWKLYKSGN